MCRGELYLELARVHMLAYNLKSLDMWRYNADSILLLTPYKNSIETESM